MPIQNVNLSEQQAKFIRKAIEDGRFRNFSEVVRAGLRLLEQHEHEEMLKLKALRRIAAGAVEEMERGQYETVEPGDIDSFIDKIDSRARRSKSR
jgi:antitoxin ParD1/3/4